MGRVAERTAGETGQQTDAERALLVAQMSEIRSWSSRDTAQRIRPP